MWSSKGNSWKMCTHLSTLAAESNVMEMKQQMWYTPDNRTECGQLPTSYMGRPSATDQYEDKPVQNSCVLKLHTWVWSMVSRQIHPEEIQQV